MPIHITMSDASKTITDWVLSRQNLTEERKAQIYEAEKYNVLTKLFNASSVLLVAGVVSAIFLAMSSAFVFLVLGLFLRTTTEKEIEKYTLPVQAQQPAPPSNEGMAARGWARLRAAFQAERQTRLLEHALHQTTEEEKVQNIFANVELAAQEGFVLDEVLLFDFSMWKNSISIPEVVVQRQEATVRREEPAPPPPPAAQQNNANAGGGIFANLVGRVIGSGAAAQAAANANNSGNQ